MSSLVKSVPISKELLFSGGAGALPYEMGFGQCLLEIIGKETLKEYLIGGVSSGSAVGGFLYSSIHTDLDMKYWYNLSGRKFFESPNKKYYGLFTNGDLVYECSKDYYSKCIEMGLKLDNKFHCGITLFENFGAEKYIVDTFESPEDFGLAIRASCYLPGVTGFGLYTTFRGKKVFDGGIMASIPYKLENSEKIFINVLPNRWPFVRDKPDNLIMLNIAEYCDLQFPLDYWLWKETWADEMFLKGYLGGMKNKDEIKKAFNI